MKELKTNDRFDKLTNLDISTHYRDKEYWLMKSDFMGAFSYWVVVQSPYDTPDISSPLSAFSGYLSFIFPDNLSRKFTYDELSNLISEDIFESIPAINKLNKPKIDNGSDILFTSRYDTPKPDHDFIDLCALARNVFYMILRQNITEA